MIDGQHDAARECQCELHFLAAGRLVGARVDPIENGIRGRRASQQENAPTRRTWGRRAVDEPACRMVTLAARLSLPRQAPGRLPDWAKGRGKRRVGPGRAIVLRGMQFVARASKLPRKGKATMPAERAISTTDVLGDHGYLSIESFAFVFRIQGTPE
jgi:hypothetical protein